MSAYSIKLRNNLKLNFDIIKKQFGFITWQCPSCTKVLFPQVENEYTATFVRIDKNLSFLDKS